MEKIEENIIIERREIIAKNRQIFCAENSGQLSSMVASAILSILGTCGFIVHSFQ
jgi:hypothetical protein